MIKTRKELVKEMQSRTQPIPKYLLDIAAAEMQNMSQGNSITIGGQRSTNNKASLGATRSKSRLKSNGREEASKVDFEKTRKVQEITGKITDTVFSPAKVYSN
jgi:hypothetical protein